MKILKNKTYKNLLLKIEVLESDKVKLQNKCDQIQNEFNLSEQRSRIKIDNLNEKLNDSREQNRLLADERDELQSKLSRKGLGKKGSKK